MALKTTFLLGGNPDPNSWDDETRAIADECFDVCEQHDLIFHFHTSPGGNSDISNFIPLVERYGKRCKIYLVHFGGGVSGHIRLVPKFLQWVKDGYKVYTDTSWAIGFGARWLLTEIEKHRRRRRPRVLRLRRAVVGLRLRVLEDQRDPRRSPRSSRSGSSGATTRSCTPAVADRALLDLDDRRLLVELQSLGVRVEDETAGDGVPGRRGGAGPADAGFIWVRGLPLTVPMHAALRARVAVHAAARPTSGPLLLHGADDVGPVARPAAAADLRHADRRRRAVLEDRAAAPRLDRLDRRPEVHLLGHAGAVRASAASS